jgi:hypothetical protein
MRPYEDRAMTRLDWLEEQLERVDLDATSRAKYEAEAAKLATSLSKRQDKEREAKLEHQGKVLRVLELYRNGDFAALYNLHGSMFEQDYEILTEGEDHVVYSSVARDNQPSRWPCPSEGKAKAKLRQLVAYRVYDHFCRNSTCKQSTSPRTSPYRDSITESRN